jgi:RimJ/RimL family protein N-acetyltransferase
VDPITLRPATINDAETVFKWRNDPFIVVRGSSQREVTWDEHIEWFGKVVIGNLCRMSIVLKDGDPIGQVRFDRVSRDICVISAYLLEAFTGKGYGMLAIRAGCREVLGLWDVSRVVACVRQDNKAARSAFVKAGFVDDKMNGCCPAAHFTLSLARADLFG